MGKHLQKLYSFRTEEELIKKIEYIAKANTRNRNQQIEHFLKLCVDDFESINGELTINENGSVTLKPKETNSKGTNKQLGKLPNYKIG